ncbi:unnamed protein product, partial [Laminaria digitata]
VYEVAKGRGVISIFAATIWVGGLIEGELRTAATEYGAWEFWAGPLDGDGNPPALCKTYDKLWEIRKEDLAFFLNTGQISTNLKNWPWHLGAPVIDGDGNPDNYNLQGGDLPELFGDQRLWWIMNDRGNTHVSTRSEPIGLEIQGSAHAFNRHGFLRNVTFYDYQLINKNSAPFTAAYFGLMTDADLGNFDDDYVGSDSLLHLGYAYNSDDDDEGGYGPAPPAIGYTFLKTAIAPLDGLDNDRDGDIDEAGEMIGMTSFAFYHDGGAVDGDPERASDFYYRMQSRWKNGQTFTVGETGYNFSEIPTKFSYSGDPVNREGWTEFTPDPFNGTLPPNNPADRRSATSTGPFRIESGDTLGIRFAVVWSRGKNNLDSVTALKHDTGTLQVTPEAYYQQSVIEPPPQPTSPVFELRFDPNFPNPFTETTTFRYSLPQTMQVRLAVFDILGREVEILVNQQQDAGIYTVNFEAGPLPSGVYMARIE